MNKSEWREEMRLRRESLTPAEQRRLSEAACDALAGTAAFAGAGTVLLYWAFGAEASTAPLVRAALAAGKRLALPRVQRNPRALVLHAWSGDPDELAESAYGVREPRADWPVVPLGAVDLMVAPGVAFDRQGARLGYGGGYYDRTLPLLRAANPGALAVGLCYGFQVVDRLPAEAHDQGVDGLATEDGVTWIPPR